MKKLNVAVLIDAWFPFRGGGQIHAQEICKRLIDKCNFTIYHADSTQAAKRTSWALRVISQVASDHKKKPFDLIHSHAYISGIPARILASALKIPVVYTVHGANTLDLNGLKSSGININVPLFKLALEKMLLTKIHYDRQISVSNNFLAYDNVNQNISVIRNGVDVAEFDKVKTRKNKKFTIIYVGRSDPVKGQSFFEEALEYLAAQNYNPNIIRITGQINDRKRLIRLYKASHVFLSSSLSEGQPLTLLEAWAAKLPVIVTAVGDNPSMVKSGINGYLVSPADSKALAEALIKAMQSRNLAALGVSGYNLVRKEYTWENTAQKTLRVYREVLHGS